MVKVFYDVEQAEREGEDLDRNYLFTVYYVKWRNLVYCQHEITTSLVITKILPLPPPLLERRNATCCSLHTYSPRLITNPPPLHKTTVEIKRRNGVGGDRIS